MGCCTSGAGKENPAEVSEPAAQLIPSASPQIPTPDDSALTDVIVIGCGPVGAAAAYLLAKQGCSVKVFEAGFDIYDLPRAVNLADDVMRMAAQVGLEHLMDHVSHIDGVDFLSPTRSGVRDAVNFLTLDPHLKPLGHPMMNMFHQPELEEFLRRRAKEEGVEIFTGHVVERFEQTESSVAVDVTSKRTGGVSRHVSRWVFGCDGASSAVRELLGVSLTDFGFDEDWLVVDLDTSEPPTRRARQVCDPIREITIVPVHGNRLRFEVKLHESDDRSTITTPEEVWKIIGEFQDREKATVVRSACYRFHALVANSFRVGRVFLAGDAAHQMPPFMGQGLNTGMRDVINLAWKISLVKGGWAEEHLLDTYELEQRPIATSFVKKSIWMGKVFHRVARNPAASFAFIRFASRFGLPPKDLMSASNTKDFPPLQKGVLAGGKHPLKGRYMPNPKEAGGTSIDSKLGAKFAVVMQGAGAGAKQLGSVAIRQRWEELGVEWVDLRPDQPDLLPALKPTQVAVVRPDRRVAAVTSASSFDAVSLEMFAVLGRSSQQKGEPQMAWAGG